MRNSGKERKQSKKKNGLFELEIRLIFTYVFVIFLVVLLMDLVLINRSSDTLSNNMGELLSAMDSQTKINIDRYQKEIEETCSLIFSNEEYYAYDAGKKQLSDYKHLKIQTDITNRLVEISMTKNFSDFGIIYRNGSSVGLIADGTKAVFGTKIFGEVEKMISDDIKLDGWFAGYDDTFERIYYAKKLNQNAILVAAIYTNELENVFSDEYGIDGMVVHLINEDDQVIYSNNDQEIGEIISQEILEDVPKGKNITLENDHYLVSVKSCERGWRIVGTIPNSVIHHSTNDMIRYSLIIAIVIIIFATFVSFLLSRTITNPLTGIVTNLNEQASFDGLTGLMRREAFRGQVTHYMEQHPEGYGAYLLIDIDDFKHFNDTYGHAVGDQVLAHVGDIFRNVFYQKCVIGRLGGDEFAIFIVLEEEHGLESLKKKLKKFYGEKSHEFRIDKERTLSITFSSGLSIYSKDGTTYKQLYEAADNRLYISKGKGKNQCTMTDE